MEKKKVVDAGFTKKQNTDASSDVWTDAQKSTTYGFVADASTDVKYLPQTSKLSRLHVGGRIRRGFPLMHLSTC